MDRLPALSSTSVEDIIAGFVPTRRFAAASFETYMPDPRFPSQAVACHRLRVFAGQVDSPARGGVLSRWLRRASTNGTPDGGARAVYLDGGYGVGKTHLLAATYHGVTGERAYLSFGELAYTISRLGLEPSLAALARTRLLCIDEFELDDVAQTRMASMFLRRLFERSQPMWIVTTSNTLPSDLGQGRFAAEAFAREIGDIAARFEVLTIDGEDYRHRQWSEPQMLGESMSNHATLQARYRADPADDGTKVLLDWPTLTKQLGQSHPVHYGQIATRLEALFVDGIDRIDDQAVALRLVHFVDKLYDGGVRLALTTVAGLPLADIFSSAYRRGGYEKKYRRCLSRLHELLSETAAATGDGVAGISRRPTG